MQIDTMLIIHTAEEINKKILELKSIGLSIGFVPTMGALHEGHKSLIDIAREENDVVVCSVFVNPTQFNDPEDFAKYPVTTDLDIALLQNAKVDIAFFPPVSEIYDERLTTLNIDLGMLDKVMEGKYRPGHFIGVVTVVKKLLDIVQPHRLYMGQKDFQQCAVVAYMIDYFKMDVDLVICPTIREKSGLALSSRNMRLDQSWKKRAAVIYKALKFCQKNIEVKCIEDLKKMAFKMIDKAGLKTEYFEIVEGKTLKAIDDAKACDYIIACCAAYAGEVRLIDNMVLKK